MKGKLGIVVGLAAGYVLGSRAGHERYDQIKEQFLKVWNTDPVQKQVDKVKDISKTAVSALPNAVWNGAVKVTKAATGNNAPGKQTPGQKLDAAVDAGKESAKDVADAAKTTANEVGDAAEDSFDDIQKAAREHDGS